MRCYFVQLIVQLIVQLRGNLCRAARTCAAQPGLLLRSPIGRFPAFLENLFPPEEEIFREITGSVKGIWAFRGFLENFVPLFV